MRSQDPNLLASVILSGQAGGALLPTKQFDGIFDATVLDTHTSNPFLCPVPGTCRVVIPSLNPTVPWGPVAYPGGSIPPNGTHCTVGFIAPVANGSADAPIRVLAFRGFPASPAYLPDLYPTTQTSTYYANYGDMVLTNGTYTVYTPTFEQGQMFGVTNYGTGTITIQIAGGGYFFGPGIANSVTQLTFGGYQSSVTFMAQAIGWQVVAGAVDTGWQPMTLLNNWVNYGSIGGNATDYSTAAYRQTANVVRLRGLVANQNAAGTTQPICNPAGIGANPPAASKVFMQELVASGYTNPGRLDFRSGTGNIAIVTGASTSVTSLSLDGMTWTTD